MRISGPLLRSPAELSDPGLSTEHAFRVEGARVLFADHALLEHDFPGLREQALIERFPELSGLSAGGRAVRTKALREDWLVRHGAVLSAPHFERNHVNTTPRQGEKIVAYRPTRYGRALVVPADDGAGGGLLDLKGAGVPAGRVPLRGRHTNGLCEMGEVLNEIMMQWLIEEIFRRAAPSLGAVPIYGVLDFGFNVRAELGGVWVPAAVEVRRAHRRPVRSLEIPVHGSVEELVKAEIELLLRGYGLTSATVGTRYRIHDLGDRLSVSITSREVHGLRLSDVRRIRELARVHAPGQRRELDTINIQLTREVSLHPTSGTLVDFGHYRFASAFERPLVSLARDRLLRWGGTLWPEDPHFVRPHPRLAVAASDFGVTADHDDDISVKLRLLTQELSQRWREGTLSGAEMHALLRGCIARSIARWA